MASQTVFFMLFFYAGSNSCWFKEVAHLAELRVAMRHKLGAVQGIQIRQAAAQVKAQELRFGFRSDLMLTSSGRREG